MMPRRRSSPLTMVLALLAGLVLAACGDERSADPGDGDGATEADAPAAPPLAGAGWMGEPVEMTGEAEHLRVVAFFKPT